MQTIRFHSTYVRLRTVPNSTHGVVEAAHFGAIGYAELKALRDVAGSTLRNAGALVVRLEGALLLCKDAPEISAHTYGEDPPAGCITCSPEQYEWVLAYSRRLAKIGVGRVVFRADQQESAFRLAEHLARERIQRLRSLQRSKPESGFACL